MHGPAAGAQGTSMSLLPGAFPYLPPLHRCIVAPLAALAGAANQTAMHDPDPAMGRAMASPRPQVWDSPWRPPHYATTPISTFPECGTGMPGCVGFWVLCFAAVSLKLPLTGTHMPTGLPVTAQISNTHGLGWKPEVPPSQQLAGRAKGWSTCTPLGGSHLLVLDFSWPARVEHGSLATCYGSSALPSTNL